MRPATPPRSSPDQVNDNIRALQIDLLSRLLREPFSHFAIELGLEGLGMSGATVREEELLVLGQKAGHFCAYDQGFNLPARESLGRLPSPVIQLLGCHLPKADGAAGVLLVLAAQL